MELYYEDMAGSLELLKAAYLAGGVFDSEFCANAAEDGGTLSY